MLLHENGGSLVLQTKDRSVACIIQQKCLVWQLVREMNQIGMGEYGSISLTSWYCWQLSPWPLSCCLTSHSPIFLRIVSFCQLSSQVPVFQLMNTYATIQVLVVLYSFAWKHWQNFYSRCFSICFVGQNKSSRHSHFWESGLPQNRKCCSLLSKNIVVNVFYVWALLSCNCGKVLIGWVIRYEVGLCFSY